MSGGDLAGSSHWKPKRVLFSERKKFSNQTPKPQWSQRHQTPKLEAGQVLSLRGTRKQILIPSTTKVGMFIRNYRTSASFRTGTVTFPPKATCSKFPLHYIKTDFSSGQI